MFEFRSWIDRRRVDVEQQRLGSAVDVSLTALLARATSVEHLEQALTQLACQEVVNADMQAIAQPADDTVMYLGVFYGQHVILKPPADVRSNPVARIISSESNTD